MLLEEGTKPNAEIVCLGSTKQPKDKRLVMDVLLAKVNPTRGRLHVSLVLPGHMVQVLDWKNGKYYCFLPVIDCNN